MIIVNYKVGQLANRLFHFSNFIAFTIEYKCKLVYPFFKEYEEYFEIFNKSVLNKRGIYTRVTTFKLIDIIVLKVLYFFHIFFNRIGINFVFIKFHSIYKYDKENDELGFNMDEAKFLNFARCKILFTSGWLYNANSNFHKHNKLIKEYFTPKKEYLDEINNIISSCRIRGDVIVGVHIRKGDYKNFNNGEWFYSNEVYYEKMLQVENLFKIKNKKVIFFICSNEFIMAEDFKNLNIFSQNRHFIVDLYSLAKCDYLMGPPSTFSMWASFYGEVPLLIIDKKDKCIDLKDFRVFISNFYAIKIDHSNIFE